MFTARLLILSSIILAFSLNVHAFSCSDVNTTIGPGGSTTPTVVRVDIGPNIVKGENQIINMNQISCKSESNTITDTLRLTGVKISPVLESKDIEIWLNIAGVKYKASEVAAKKPIVISVGNSSSATIPIIVYFKLNNNPTKDLNIKKGTDLLTLYFNQTNNVLGCPQCGPYNWKIRANNTTFLPTNSCKFQNGSTVDVDFGTFRANQLSTNPKENNQLAQNTILSYACDDKNTTIKVAIRVIGEAPSFSSSLIKTSNKNIGIAVLHNDTQVLPGNTFEEQIVNGSGSTTIGFIPVKNAVRDDEIGFGPWSGSVSFIMTIP